jgi:hypothetical protein
MCSSIGWAARCYGTTRSGIFHASCKPTLAETVIPSTPQFQLACTPKDRNLQTNHITMNGGSKECTVALRFPRASTVAASQHNSVAFCTHALLACSVHNLPIWQVLPAWAQQESQQMILCGSSVENGNEDANGCWYATELGILFASAHCWESCHSSRPSPAAVATLHGSKITSAPSIPTLPGNVWKHGSPTSAQTLPMQRHVPSATVKHISSVAVMPLTIMKDGFSATVRASVTPAQSKTNEQAFQTFMWLARRFAATKIQCGIRRQQLMETRKLALASTKAIGASYPSGVGTAQLKFSHK